MERQNHSRSWKIVFIRYFAKYFIVFLLVLLPCVLVVRSSWNISRSHLQSVGERELTEGMYRLSTEVSKMKGLVKTIQKDEHFGKLLNAENERKESVDLYKLKSYMREMRTFCEISQYFFVLFESTDFFVSTYQHTESFSRLKYGSFFSMNRYDTRLEPEEMKALIFEETSKSMPFIALDNISYMQESGLVKMEEPILCVLGDQLSQLAVPEFRISFVITKDMLVSLFLPPESLESGFLRIIDAKGEVLLEYGDVSLLPDMDGGFLETDEYLILSGTESTETDWVIQVGLPKENIFSQMSSLYVIIWIYVVAAFLMALLFSLYFSRRQYLELHGLFDLALRRQITHERMDYKYESLMNIYRRIVDNNERYQQQIEEQEQEKYTIRLENLITGGFSTPKEQEEFKNFGIFSTDFYCVAILRMNAETEQDYNIAMVSLTEYLKGNWEEQVYHIHTGIQDECFLFSMPLDCSPDVRQIQSLFQEIVGLFAKEGKATMGVGISMIGSDLVNLQRCYTQALQVLTAYYQEDKSSVNSYNIEMKNSKDVWLTLEFQEKLYHIILYQRTEELLQTFLSMKAYYRRDPVLFEIHKPRLFYAIQNIICNVSLQSGARMTEEELTAFDGQDSVEVLLDKLYMAAHKLISKIEIKKNEEKSAYEEEVFSYLNENFANQEMSISYMCCQKCLSEKYLQNIIREKTGESFAVYLEKLRIERAAELLQNTDYSNEQIIEATGFLSERTFYRAFNKRMGMSPKAFRSGRTN